MSPKPTRAARSRRFSRIACWRIRRAAAVPGIRQSAGHAMDTIIDVIGRAAIEAVVEIGAADVAGPKASRRFRLRLTTHFRP